MNYTIGQQLTIKGIEYEVVGIHEFAEDSNIRTKLNKWGELLVKRTFNSRYVMKVYLTNDGRMYPKFNIDSIPNKYAERYISEWSNTTEAIFDVEDATDTQQTERVVIPVEIEKETVVEIETVVNTASIDTQAWGEVISALTTDPRNWNAVSENNRDLLITIYNLLSTIEIDEVTVWEAAKVHATYLARKKGNIHDVNDYSMAGTSRQRMNRESKIIRKLFVS